MADPESDNVACPFGTECADYWQQRKQLFSLWDDGVKFDEVGLFSIKPEDVAAEIAAQLNGDCVLDAFAGLGGSAIAFARQGKQVIAFETCHERLQMAAHNARLYGVADDIRFVHGDVFQGWTAVRDEVDAIYLDPPWGGPAYANLKTFTFVDFDTEGSGDVRSLVATAHAHRKYIALSLPRTFDARELTDLHRELLAQRDGEEPDQSGIHLSRHTRGTKVLFLTAFL